MTTQVTAGVILSLIPIFACVWETLILKETTSLLQKIFLVIGVIGVIYIVINTDTNDGKNTVFGIICLVIATVTGPLHLVFSRQSLKVFKPFEVTYFACLLGTVVFNTINVVKHIYAGNLLDYFDPYFNSYNILRFIALSIAATLVATAMNNFSMSRLQASTVTAFSGVSTVVTIIIGAINDSENKLYYFHYIGFALILIRMVGVSYIAIRKDKLKAKDSV
ncbi:MAG: DMT family transporter [Clostridia bacterium]|nr:DMT family transporter [Clostridia bacterium]